MCSKTRRTRSLVARVCALAAWTGLLSLALEPAAHAQEPVTQFSQLEGRVEVGDRLWVTDIEGSETRGRLERMTPTSLTVNAAGTRLFEADSISLIRRRQHDSLKNGALIGLAAGGGMATAWCIGALADDSGDIDAAVECSEGFIFAGLGTLIGTAVDAIIPGKLSVIYRAGSRPDRSSARSTFSVVPLIGTHRIMLIGVVRQ